MTDSPPPGRRRPGDYRPDLRPMLILFALLAAVLIAWVLLSPLILPAASGMVGPPMDAARDGRVTSSPS